MTPGSRVSRGASRHPPPLAQRGSFKAPARRGLIIQIKNNYTLNYTNLTKIIKHLIIQIKTPLYKSKTLYSNMAKMTRLRQTLALKCFHYQCTYGICGKGNQGRV